MAQYTNSPLFKDHTAYSLRFTRTKVVRLPLFLDRNRTPGPIFGAGGGEKERERERGAPLSAGTEDRRRERWGLTKKCLVEPTSNLLPAILLCSLARAGGSSLREKGYVRRGAAWLPATVVPASNYTIVVVVAKKGERAYSKEEEDTFSPSPFHPSDAPLSFAACFGGAGFDKKTSPLVQLLQTSQVGDKKKRRLPFFPTVDGDFPFSPPLFPQLQIDTFATVLSRKAKRGGGKGVGGAFMGVLLCT